MLVALLASAFASSHPQFSVAGGPVVAGGFDTTYGYWGTRYASIAPMIAGDVTWHWGPLETFAGGSLSGLLASEHAQQFPASLVNADFGVGFGRVPFGVGLYGSIGYPHAQGGLYTHFTFPTDNGRMGGELRFFSVAGLQLSGTALLFRWEPEDPHYRRPPPPPAAPPPPPPPLYSDPPYEG